MISSRQPITVFRGQYLPWSNLVQLLQPNVWNVNHSVKVVGCVSSIHTHEQSWSQNSGIPNIPVGVPPVQVCTPKNLSLKSFITSGSSARISFGTPINPATYELRSDHHVPVTSLQYVLIDIVEIKVAAVGIISRILNRCEIIDIHIIWNNNDTTWCWLCARLTQRHPWPDDRPRHHWSGARTNQDSSVSVVTVW